MKACRIFLFFFTFFVLLYSCFYVNSKKIDKKEQNYTDVSLDTQDEKETRINYANIKAMWLSQYDLCDIYSTDEYDFRERISKIFDNCKSIGINTVIVQVRPNSDSMYPSEFFAPSVYVVGKYGNEFEYDPFRIIVEEAHEKELSLHAWINPLRAMKESEIELIGDKYSIVKWWRVPALKERYLPVVDDRVYLNPAYSEVRELIVHGVREIIQNYSVDGIHMDDYFYPTTDTSFDAEAYTLYGNGMSLGDFRRNNINLLVKELYAAVKEEDKNLLFGISPAGTLEKDYAELYADVYTWCNSDGYVDYLCPQLYFGFEHETCAFDDLLDKWDSIIKTDGVALWVGLSLGKAVNAQNGIVDKWAGDTGRDEWMRRTDIIKRSLEYTKTSDKCVGVSFFSYQYFYDPMTDEENIISKAERENFLPILKSIKW